MEQYFDRNDLYVNINNGNENFKQLKKIISKIPFAEDAVALYYCSIDSNVPLKVRAAAAAAIAYVVLPLDAVPDFIAIAGYADDCALVASAVFSLDCYVTDEHRHKAKMLLGMY